MGDNLRRCPDCGGEIENPRARRCVACQKKHEQALRAARTEKHRHQVECARCHKIFTTCRNARYCPDCCFAAGREKQKETMAARRRAKEEAAVKLLEKPKDPLYIEPGGDPNSLEHVMWELKMLNWARHKKGQAPISYGQYVIDRPQRPWNKKRRK